MKNISYFSQTRFMQTVMIASLLWLCAGQVSAEAQAVSSSGIFSDKTLLLVVHSDGEMVSIQNAFLKTLRFTAKSNPENKHYYNLLSESEEVLYTGDFPDPLVRWVDDFSNPDLPEGGQESVTQSDFMLKVPYLEAATSIRFEYENAAGDTVSLGVSPLTLTVQ